MRGREPRALHGALPKDMRLLAGSLLLVAVACAGDAPSATSPTPSALSAIAPIEAGQKLSDATLPYIDRQGELSLSELRGQPAVLNFWASWCAFCVDEMPDVQAVHEDLGDDVRFIGIDREDDRDKAIMLARGTGVTYELVADDDASFYRAVQARGMPTTIVVDDDGVIVARHTDPIDAEGLRDLLEEHLPEVASSRARGG